VPFTYEYPRPAVTVDVALFTMRAGDLAVLLVQRKRPPFEGAWALPGGFVGHDEGLLRAALRELQEETGVTGVALEQLGAYGDPGRDPRGHTVSVAFVGFVVAEAHPVTAGDDAARAAWIPLGRIASRSRSRLRVAFDHATIIGLARERLCERLGEPAAPSATLELLPPRFTLTELQHVFEVVFGRRLDARTFRARLRARGLVEAVASGPAPTRTGARGRTANGAKPARGAQLYRWRRRHTPVR
jgi:8-oxo-dGTP diphosphatase